MTTERTAESLKFGPVLIHFDDQVLRPRPWTLAQSEWAAELVEGMPPGRVLELCSGAGHIGLAVAALTWRRLVQVDLDPHACEWARYNADHAGLADLVEVRHGAIDAAVRPDERFLLVLADPPYVPSSDMERYPEDPELAIDGGDSGMEIVQLALRVAGSHVAQGGTVLLQLGGPQQADAVVTFLEEPDAPALTVAECRSFGPDRSVVRLTPAQPTSTST